MLCAPLFGHRRNVGSRHSIRNSCPSGYQPLSTLQHQTFLPQHVENFPSREHEQFQASFLNSRQPFSVSSEQLPFLTSRRGRPLTRPAHMARDGQWISSSWSVCACPPCRMATHEVWCSAVDACKLQVCPVYRRAGISGVQMRGVRVCVFYTKYCGHRIWYYLQALGCGLDK